MKYSLIKIILVSCGYLWVSTTWASNIMLRNRSGVDLSCQLALEWGVATSAQTPMTFLPGNDGVVGLYFSNSNWADDFIKAEIRCTSIPVGANPAQVYNGIIYAQDPIWNAFHRRLSSDADSVIANNILPGIHNFDHYDIDDGESYEVYTYNYTGRIDIVGLGHPTPAEICPLSALELRYSALYIRNYDDVTFAREEGWYMSTTHFLIWEE